MSTQYVMNEFGADMNIKYYKFETRNIIQALY